MKRLSGDTLADLPARFGRTRPESDTVGIVHFGPGAFHRAHQAVYTDALLEQDRPKPRQSRADGRGVQVACQWDRRGHDRHASALLRRRA